MTEFELKLQSAAKLGADGVPLVEVLASRPSR